MKPTLANCRAATGAHRPRPKINLQGYVTCTAPAPDPDTSPGVTAGAIEAAACIRSLSAQLAEARRERDNEWLPIESAPNDGTHLLAIVDGDVRRIAWGKTSHIPIVGFCLADQGAEDFDLCDPTHWRPLPVPPTAIHTGDDDE